MNVQAGTNFCSHERMSEMRNDLAGRRRARVVNLGALARAHGAALLADARRHGGRGGRAALARLVADGQGERWSAATSRDLAASIAGLSAAVARLPTSSATDALVWRLDRLREIKAQDDRIAALEAALAALTPTDMRRLTLRAGGSR